MVDAFASGGCFHSRTAMGMFDHVKQVLGELLGIFAERSVAGRRLGSPPSLYGDHLPNLAGGG